MDQEAINFYQRMFTVPSFWEKMKKKIKIFLLPSHEVKAMEKVLIMEAKPIFFAHTKEDGKVMDEITRAYFDERIETLPKEALYDLYTSFSDFKKANGKSYEKDALYKFVTHLELTYSLNGWFLDKLHNLILSTVTH